MIEWIATKPTRFLILIASYFAIHVVVRTCVSPSLSFDESEQAFLSQWLQVGYNSQPPLYTWLQGLLYAAMGYNVLPVALLKNVFLFGTYAFVFRFARRATSDPIAATIAALGMLTMPQIAWESHRDLSHTVAAMFAVAWLLDVADQAANERTWMNYLGIGLACSVGLMSKYNFALVIIALLFAAISLPRYRAAILSPKLTLSLLVTTIAIGPHLVWMVHHPDIVSGKTLTQFAPESPLSWLDTATQGGVALVTATLGCCVSGALAVTWCCYRPTEDRRRAATTDAQNDGRQLDATRWLERFLGLVGLALVAMVAAGVTVNFKTHWLQPFLFLVPCYVVLKLKSVSPRHYRIDRLAARRMIAISGCCAVAVLTTTIIKPISAGLRGDYSWLNVPYSDLSATMQEQLGQPPAAIYSLTMRTAGNLRHQFPDVAIASRDHQHLVPNVPSSQQPLVAVIDSDDPAIRKTLEDWIRGQVHSSTEVDLRWEAISSCYLYGKNDHQKTLYVAVIPEAPPTTSVHKRAALSQRDIQIR